MVSEKINHRALCPGFRAGTVLDGATSVPQRMSCSILRYKCISFSTFLRFVFDFIGYTITLTPEFLHFMRIT